MGPSQHTPWINGNWRIENETLIQDQGADGFVGLMENQLSTQTLQTDIKLNGPSGYGGLTLWFQNNSNYIDIVMYPAAEKLFVTEKIDGTSNTTEYPLTFASHNTWYTLKVIANSTSGNLYMYIDENTVATHTVTTSIRSGQSGVNNGNAGGYFDNFKITFSNPPQTVSVNTFQVSSSGEQEKWYTIYQNNIYYASGGRIYGFNTKTKETFPLFESDFPLHPDFFALVAYDGQYLVYNTYSVEQGSNVRVYDMRRKNDIAVTNEVGSHWADDYDRGTLIYIEGGACGPLYAYNIRRDHKTLITQQACSPTRMSRNIVVWGYAAPGGSDIYGYDLRRNTLFPIVEKPGLQESVDIDGNYVVWREYGITPNTYAIYRKNIRTGKTQKLLETNDYYVSWPAVSKDYVIWGKSSIPHMAGVEGINLRSGEIFEIQEEGPHQNTNLSPIINKNIAAWMAWRTGNGDVYGSVISK